MKAALQVYSVKEHAKRDMRETLHKISEIGYHGVEFAGLYGYALSDVKTMLDETGLIPISAHVSLDAVRDDPDGVIGGYSELGCSYIAIPHVGADRLPSGGRFDETLRDIAAMAVLVRRHGMRLLYHNHYHEFETTGGEYALDMLYRTIPADLLSTQIDTCWVSVAGEDPAAYVRKYAGRAPIVHVRDFYMSAREKGTGPAVLISGPADGVESRPVGYGMQDVPAIISACRDAGTDWLVVEYNGAPMGRAALTCAATSFAYLAGLGAVRRSARKAVLYSPI
ncbi:MAG: sugar phosphate isomerase/epimerase [Clostridiales bacterium]|nr:sugar phosphate isomerase/epimerase [Clostridiales bacterium]